MTGENTQDKMLALRLSPAWEARENADEDARLLQAASRGRNEEVLALLDAFADTNAADKKGVTVLMHAVSGCDLPTAKMLIALGADLNAQDKDGNTPLYHAVDYGALEHIRLLLDAGADMHIQNNKGRSARSHASDGAAHGLETIENISILMEQTAGHFDRQPMGTSREPAAEAARLQICTDRAWLRSGRRWAILETENDIKPVPAVRFKSPRPL